MDAQLCKICKQRHMLSEPHIFIWSYTDTELKKAKKEAARRANAGTPMPVPILKPPPKRKRGRPPKAK